MAVVLLPQRPSRAQPVACCSPLRDAGRQPSFSAAPPALTSNASQQATLAYHDALPDNSTPHQTEEGTFDAVAIGLENSRTFGGIHALEAVIGHARREAWVELKLEYAKQSPPCQFDGALLFGQVPRLGAELNSDRVLDELFGVCAHNWKQLTPTQHSEAKIMELRSLWLQATRGDCDEIEPLDPALRKRWLAWFKLGGLGRQEAKRRYLRSLKRLDQKLVVPHLPTAPPPGFPKAKAGIPLCARCNTARGCDAPIFIDADQFSSSTPVLLASKLSDLALLRGNHHQLANILDRAVASQCCVHGVHQKLSKAQARQFSSWFTLPGLGGFLEHRDIDKTTGHPTAFECVAAELHEAIIREHRAHASLCCPSDTSTIAVELSEHTRHSARDCQAELCERLRDFWQSWTGRPFIMKEVCSRKTAACVHRRHTVDRTNGAVHKHIVNDDDLPSKPKLSLRASYGAVAELRRGTGRLGAPRETGPPSQAGCSKITATVHSDNTSALDNIDRGVAETALVLAERIAVEHLKESRRLEAAASLSTRDRLREAKRRMVARAARKKQRSDLVAAIEARNLVKVIALVAAGAGAHRETMGGVTALMACVLQNDRGAVTELAKLKDVDLDYPSKLTGLSALALACKRGSAAMVHHLLDLGASPLLPRKYAIVGLLGTTASALKSLRRYESDNTFVGPDAQKEPSDSYESPVPESDEDEQPRLKSLARHFAIPPCAAAATAGQVATLSVLLSCVKSRYGPSAVHKLVNQRYGPHNATALHYVVQKRDTRTALELLGNQARLDIRDLQRHTPVDLAFASSSSAKQARRITMLKTASPLAHFLASTSGGERSGQCDVVDAHGAAPLSRRALLAHAKLNAAIKTLAAASSDMHTLDASQGDDIISAARANVDSAAQKVVDLVAHDANTSLDLETAEGATPLIAAAVSSSRSVVGALVDAGCAPNYANKNQRTALMAAAMARNVGAALVLLQKGAEAKRRDLDGRTAACFAKEKAAGEFDVIVGEEKKRLIVDEHDDLLDDLLLTAATISNEVAIDRFEAACAIAAATNTKKPLAFEEADNSWQWRLYPEQSRNLGASSMSKALPASTSSDSPEKRCGIRGETMRGASQREVRGSTEHQQSTSPLASSSKMKHTRTRRREHHVSISDAQESAKLADERRLEGQLFREHPLSYVWSLKSSYCSRFGAAKLDDLLHGRRRKASRQGQAELLLGPSSEDEEVPPDGDTITSQDDTGSCTSCNCCIASLCCSDAPSCSAAVDHGNFEDASIAESEAPPLSPGPCEPDTLARFFADGGNVEEDDYSILESDDDVDESQLAQEFSRVKLCGFALLSRQAQETDDSGGAWRAPLERLKKNLAESEITNLSKRPPPELEYASYMVTKGQFTKAAWTLHALRRKQRRNMRFDDDVRAVMLARTDRARADLEEARQNPHRAIRLRRRALVTLLRVLGPGDGHPSALSREIERSIAQLAAIYCKLGARHFAVGLYEDLGATYAASQLESRRNFARRMLAQRVALVADDEDARDPFSE